MESNAEPIFKPWFKTVVRVCFVLVAGHAFVTGHLSPVRITKNLLDKKSAEVVDGRLVLNGGAMELYCPLLAYVPKNEVVDAALRKGVEILPSGDVICVLQIECPGFFNPVSYEEKHVNLAALAIATDKNCINVLPSDDIMELMSIVGQMPADERFRTIGPRGWHRANMASLNAVAEMIARMPQAKWIQRAAECRPEVRNHDKRSTTDTARQWLLNKTLEHKNMVKALPERVKTYFKDKHVAYAAEST